MKRVLAICCSLFIFFTVAGNSSYAQKEDFSIKVWPSKLELNSTPGTMQEFEINIKNEGSKDQVLRIYANDYYVTQDNKYVFKEPGHYSYSCAKWITTYQNRVIVPVGEIKKTRFKLTSPKNAEPGGHYAILLFEQVPEKTKGQEDVVALPRIGVAILTTVPGEIVRKLEIKDVSVTNSFFWPGRSVLKLPRNKIKARVVVYNAGNVHVTARGRVTYSPTFGWGAGTVALDETTILPKTKRYMQADLPNPPLVGSYDVKAQVEYGPNMDTFDTELSGKASFHSYPIGLFLMVVLLIALAIAAYELILWWRRRRKGEPGGDAEKEKKEDEKQKPEKKEKKKKKKEDLGLSEDSIEDERDKKEEKVEAPGDETESEDKEKQVAEPVNPLKDGWKKLTGMVLGQGLWAEMLRGRWQEKRFIKALEKENVKAPLKDKDKKEMGGPDEEDFQRRSPMKLFDD